MKKALTFLVITIVILLLFLTQFGIQVGNVRIGKQIDLQTKQNSNFEQSAFYTQYYSKSDLTVLNLWATWCEPCIEEMPDLNFVKEYYKKEKINFLSLSIDTDSVKLEKFNNLGKFKFYDVTMSNLKYRNAILNSLENRKPDQWIASSSVPVTYLIKNKKVVKKFDGTLDKEELKRAIEEYK